MINRLFKKWLKNNCPASVSLSLTALRAELKKAFEAGYKAKEDELLLEEVNVIYKSLIDEGFEQVE